MIIPLLLVLLTLTSSTEVDNLNILLPQLHQAIPTFPLQLITAQDGCYHWTSSLPDTVQVSPHNPKSTGCSRQALIEVAKVGAFPSSIFVSADDANSESLIKIPVRIRKLHKISIASKSRMMNIKQIQRLQLFAYDSEENTFTSIEGLRFKWRLEQAGKILQLVPLSSAHLFLPLRTRQNIEKAGHQSDMIVVRALAPGNLKVTATCIQPGYEHLNNEITISVHERFDLHPGPIIRMAPQTSLQLRLVRPSGQQIQLPQTYYHMISCDGFSVNSTLYLTVPDRTSRCTLKVQDTRTKPVFESSVDIIVEHADELRIITSPLVIVGVQSPYQVQLLRQGVVLLGESKKIKYRSEYSLDSSRMVLMANKKMTGILYAELGPLRKEITINSFLPVTAILPNNYLHLPVGQYFKLRLLGGTGLFDYEINSEIATISSIYVLHAKSVGNIVVTIRDRNHLANFASFRLKVSDLTDIHSLEVQKQLNRDEWGNMYVIGRSSGHEIFTQCHYASFSLTVPSANLQFDKKLNQLQALKHLQNTPSSLVQQVLSSTSLFKGKHNQIIKSYNNYVLFNQIDSTDLRQYVLSLENYGICKVVRFKSIITLEETLTVSLDGEEGISTKLPFRVYNHISTTINGEDQQFLMTPQSSLKWVYTGGSYKWPQSYTVIQVNGKTVNSTLAPIIKCDSQQRPKTTYQLRVVNQHTRRLLFPTEQHVNITIICKYPKKLHLKLQHGEAYDELFIESQRIVKGDVEASDQFNQIFYNSSNVLYEFSSVSGSINSLNKQFSYKPNGLNDTVTFFTEQLNSGLKYKRVSQQIQIFIVKPIRVEHPLTHQDRSKNISIFTLFTPKKPYVINIFDLHSQIHVQCTKAVTCERGQNYIAVKLLKIGVGYVTIRDKKVYGSDTWNFQFIIVESDEVRISGDRDHVQEGQVIHLTITNYHNGQLISPYTYEPTYLGLLSNKNIKILEQRMNTFVIKAQEAGQYEIYGQNSYPRVLRSQYPLNLTVYKQIQPSIESVSTLSDGGFLMIQAKTVILIGCRRLIRIQGGPKEMVLTYHSESSNIKLTSIGRRNVQISSTKQGTFDVVIEATYKNTKIALIMISVLASTIQSIELQSIEQPVVGAHFRIHPRFKVGNSDLQDSICDFHYNWSASKGLIKLGQSMSFGYIDAAGINATAIQAGTQVISLEVVSIQSGRSLGSAQKYLQILNDIVLGLPTYINRQPCCPPTSIIMPPSTSYSFDKHLSASTQGNLVTVGEHRNTIDSGKRLGSTTVSLSRPSYQPLQVFVKVKQVMGIFIDNTQGFISLEPDSTVIVPIYLQDNTGRLFINPLQQLQMIAYSSNSELLSVKLSPHHDSLTIRSKSQGICIVSVILPGRNLIDSMIVSIGSALSPGKLVRVLTRGKVQFSSISAQGSWLSANPKIASIDPVTGSVETFNEGTTKITYGQLSSTIEVLKVSKVMQVGPQKYKGSSLQVTYKMLWKTGNGLEELPHLTNKGSINNNFRPQCYAHSRYLTSSLDIIDEDNHERLQCTISAAEGEQLPSKIYITIKEQSHNDLEVFSYQIKPHFTLQKYTYSLSSANPKTTLSIKTTSQIQVGVRNGKTEWIYSQFNQDRGVQNIVIDMSNFQGQQTWWLQLSCTGQKEDVKFVFSAAQKEKERSFWSFSLDWPDYLIIIMGIVFATICYIQYKNDQKIKNE